MPYLPNISLDWDRAWRKNLIAIPDSQLILPEHILRTQNTEVYEAAAHDNNYRAAILQRTPDEISVLKNKFAFALSNYSLCRVSDIETEIDDNGRVTFIHKHPETKPLTEGAAGEELAAMVLGHQRMTGEKNIIIEFAPNFRDQFHDHQQFDVTNMVLGDSGTGYYTHKGPGNAGEGNKFYFKAGVAHQGTTREIDGQPKHRLTIILYKRPNPVLEYVSF